MTAVLGANVAVGVSAGSHVCALFSSDAERRQLVQTFLSGRARDRLVYVGAPTDLAQPTGIDVRAPESVYLAGGGFDPAGVLSGFRGEIAHSIASGHRRLRVAADMSWAAEGADPTVLVSYEAAATELHKEGTAAGMCLYDRRRFPEDLLDAICAAHPFTADSSDTVNPSAFTAIQERDGTLHLRGEIDYFGASHLAAVLADGPDRRDDLVIDVSKVRFIDVAALHALGEAAAALPGTHRVVLRSPSRLVRKLVALLPDVAAERLVTSD